MNPVGSHDCFNEASKTSALNTTSNRIRMREELGISILTQHSERAPAKGSRCYGCLRAAAHWIVWIMTFGLCNLFPKSKRETESKSEEVSSSSESQEVNPFRLPEGASPDDKIIYFLLFNLRERAKQARLDADQTFLTSMQEEPNTNHRYKCEVLLDGLEANKDNLVLPIVSERLICHTLITSLWKRNSPLISGSAFFGLSIQQAPFQVGNVKLFLNLLEEKDRVLLKEIIDFFAASFAAEQYEKLFDLIIPAFVGRYVPREQVSNTVYLAREEKFKQDSKQIAKLFPFIIENRAALFSSP